MSKELETIKSFQNKRTFDVTYDNGTQKHYETKTIGELFPKEINKIEAELQKAEKYKKVVEIIKEKKWLVEDILDAFIEDKEKYDLLKEIFKDE